MAALPQEISDEVLLIRRWKEGDETRLAQLLDHPMIYDLSPYGPRKLPADLLEKEIAVQIQSENQIRYVVIPRDLNQIIGTVGCHVLDGERLEIGFWTGFKYWNQGFTIRAVKLVVNVAKNCGRYSRIEARCFERNSASAHILKKSGFCLEGRINHFPLYDRPPESILTFFLTCPKVNSHIDETEFVAS